MVRYIAVLIALRYGAVYSGMVQYIAVLIALRYGAVYSGINSNAVWCGI